MTDDERRQLAVWAKSDASGTPGFLAALLAFGASLAVMLLALERFPGYPKALELAAIAVSLCIGSYAYLRARHSSARLSFAVGLRAELARGEVEVARCQVVDAVEVEEFEDEGLGFYLRDADGRVLFLQGQYLYEPVEERRFPCTEIETVRLPAMGLLLDLKTSGSYLPPSRRLPSFREEQYRAGAVPEDGAILEVDFDSLGQ